MNARPAGTAKTGIAGPLKPRRQCSDASHVYDQIMSVVLGLVRWVVGRLVPLRVPVLVCLALTVYVGAEFL